MVRNQDPGQVVQRRAVDQDPRVLRKEVHQGHKAQRKDDQNQDLEVQRKKRVPRIREGHSHEVLKKKKEQKMRGAGHDQEAQLKVERVQKMGREDHAHGVQRRRMDGPDQDQRVQQKVMIPKRKKGGQDRRVLRKIHLSPDLPLEVEAKVQNDHNHDQDQDLDPGQEVLIERKVKKRKKALEDYLVRSQRIVKKRKAHRLIKTTQRGLLERSLQEKERKEMVDEINLLMKQKSLRNGLKEPPHLPTKRILI